MLLHFSIRDSFWWGITPRSPWDPKHRWHPRWMIWKSLGHTLKKKRNGLVETCWNLILVACNRWSTQLVSGFNPSEKYESQLGSLFPICIYIYNNKSHVPNHQTNNIVPNFNGGVPWILQVGCWRWVPNCHGWQSPWITSWIMITNDEHETTTPNFAYVHLAVSWNRGYQIIQVMDDHLSIDTYGDLGYPHFRIPPVPHYVFHSNQGSPASIVTISNIRCTSFSMLKTRQNPCCFCFASCSKQSLLQDALLL